MKYEKDGNKIKIARNQYDARKIKQIASRRCA